jgi:hypothetical protein
LQVKKPATAASDTRPYFYRPIAYYADAVLKCYGIAADKNRGWMMA